MMFAFWCAWALISTVAFIAGAACQKRRDGREIGRLRAELADVKAMSGYQWSLGYDDGYRTACLRVTDGGDW